MSDIKIQPSGSGTAVVTLTAPTTNTARTITFPDATGTLLNSGSTLDATKLSGNLPAISAANLTAIPAANITGTLPAISGANLTGLTSAQMPTGSIIQVVSADIGALTTSTTQSWVDTNASIAITPQFANSKIICMFNFVLAVWGLARIRSGYQLVRGSTVIQGGSNEVVHLRELSGGYESMFPVCLNYTDSPNTTSATTYKIQINAHTSGHSVQLVGQGNTRPGHMILMEVAG